MSLCEGNPPAANAFPLTKNSNADLALTFPYLDVLMEMQNAF